MCADQANPRQPLPRCSGPCTIGFKRSLIADSIVGSVTRPVPSLQADSADVPPPHFWLSPSLLGNGSSGAAHVVRPYPPVRSTFPAWSDLGCWNGVLLALPSGGTRGTLSLTFVRLRIIISLGNDMIMRGKRHHAHSRATGDGTQSQALSWFF